MFRDLFCLVAMNNRITLMTLLQNNLLRNLLSKKPKRAQNLQPQQPKKCATARNRNVLNCTASVSPTINTVELTAHAMGALTTKKTKKKDCLPKSKFLWETHLHSDLKLKFSLMKAVFLARILTSRKSIFSRILRFCWMFRRSQRTLVF